MSSFVPECLQAETNADRAVSAAYFVVRVLRNKLRGFPELAVSPEVDASSQQLVRRSLDEIAAREGVPILEMSDDRVQILIASLSDFVTARSMADVAPSNHDRGLALLAALRSQRL